jgi:uncharacterized protein YjbJ (UPF0337 family)
MNSKDAPTPSSPNPRALLTLVVPTGKKVQSFGHPHPTFVGEGGSHTTKRDFEHDPVRIPADCHANSAFLSGRNHDGQPTFIWPDMQFRKEEPMNWDRIEGNWMQFKGKVRQQWGKLTDDDMELVEGKRTELVGRIQERYGIARDKAEREIDSWLKTVH